MADIKKSLRVALAQRNMTQTELAELLEVTPQMVSRWISSEADLNVKTVGRIAEVLGLSVSELVALGE